MSSSSLCRAPHRLPFAQLTAGILFGFWVTTSRSSECNLSGTNTRWLRGALAPLLLGVPLSKDAVSRLVGRLREYLAAWAKRDLGEPRIRSIFLDGWYPRVRIGKKRVRVPVLVTLGVCANGQLVVLDLRLAERRVSKPGSTRCARWPPAISALRCFGRD